MMSFTGGTTTGKAEVWTGVVVYQGHWVSPIQDSWLDLDEDVRIAQVFAAFLDRLQAAVWRRRAYAAVRHRSSQLTRLRSLQRRFRAYARRNGRPRQRTVGLNYSKARQ